jgi:alkylresorcinol/alkylpyrone synthase
MESNRGPHIVAAASAFPEYYYPQEALTAEASKWWTEHGENGALLERFHKNLKVRGRHLSRPLEQLTQPGSFQERNDAWIRTAVELGEKAVCSLLEKAALPAEDVQLFAFTSTTGIAVPSIDARLMNRIPFSPRMKRMPLFGLGCMGGAGGLARIADYLVGHPAEAAVLLSVELCSLTIQYNDLSVENMIASGLFADGAAAVLMAGSEHPLAKTGQPRLVDSRSMMFAGTEYVMGWDVRDTGFKVVLSADLVDVLQAHLRPGLDEFLAEHALEIGQVERWIVHPGGPKIIDGLENHLQLPAGTLDASRKILESLGNLSSATVLILLEQALEEGPAAAGSHALLMAMGPGFNAELVLLEW